MLNALLGLLTGLLLGGIVCTTGMASPISGPDSDRQEDRGRPVHDEKQPATDREALTAYFC